VNILRINEVGVSRFGWSEMQPSETVKSLLCSPDRGLLFSATFGVAEKSKVFVSENNSAKQTIV
ncbi:MAG: hypothetical protein DRN08_05890, partial [Thermoplasmata archaeon]